VTTLAPNDFTQLDLSCLRVCIGAFRGGQCSSKWPARLGQDRRQVDLLIGPDLQWQGAPGRRDGQWTWLFDDRSDARRRAQLVPRRSCAATSDSAKTARRGSPSCFCGCLTTTPDVVSKRGRHRSRPWKRDRANDARECSRRRRSCH